MGILKKVYKLSAISLLLFGILAFYLSFRDLPFGSFSAPKAGFVPTIFSALLIVFSTINLIIELRKPDKIPPKMEHVDWAKWLKYIGICVMYIVLINVVGFLFATIICLFSMFKITNVKGVLRPAVISGCFAILIWVIFTYAMNVRLPSLFD